MTHPEDLLADYVDGTLPDRERAVVDAHLDTCARCREEVELARSAVTALAAVEELPVPLGVTGPVLAEAGRRFERGRTRTWQRLQWAAGAGVAAALVLVVALSGGLRGGGGDDAAETAGGDGAAGATAGEDAAALARDAAAPPPLELQPDVTYTEDGIRSLAEDARASAAGPATEATAPRADMSQADARPAVRCLRNAGAPVGSPDAVLFRLIEATFDDTPAYLAVFLQGPGASQPADHAVVWVVATEDCRILNTASLPI
jgi:hypothetical protein